MRHRVITSATFAAALLLFLQAFPRPAGAQTPTAPPPVIPDEPHGRLSITLVGGWSSFAQGAVNRSIRLDNLLLTAPADSGGAGLDEGLGEIADGLGLGAEIRWRLSPEWSLMAGVQRLYDRSQISFTRDLGGGPQPGRLEYEVRGFPIYVGAYREFSFSARATYRLGVALLYFPDSVLAVNGEIAGATLLAEKGSTNGVGAMFSWGGGLDLGGGLSLDAGVRLRLGRIGDPVDADGDVIQTLAGMRLAPMDWSGVDLLVGITYSIF